MIERSQFKLNIIKMNNVYINRHTFISAIKYLLSLFFIRRCDDPRLNSSINHSTPKNPYTTSRVDAYYVTKAEFSRPLV